MPRPTTTAVARSPRTRHPARTASRLCGVGLGVCLTIFAAGLGGCQSSRTFVLTEPTVGRAFRAVRFHEQTSPKMLTASEREAFEKAMRSELSRNDAFAEGDDLTIDYRVILRDEGSSGARVGAAIVNLTGVPTGAVGMGTLGVEVVYRDAQDRELGRLVADGPIDGPLATTRDGLLKAAKSIALYTRTQFAADGVQARLNDPTLPSAQPVNMGEVRR